MGKNRTMDAKRIKYIRQSRARPRALMMGKGYQRVPQSVDRSKIPKEYEGLFEYRTRAKGLIDPYLEALFPGSTEAEDTHNQYLASIKGERDHKMCVELVSGRLRKVLKRFDARMNCIEFMEYLSVPKLLRVSVTYSSDNRAMDCYENGSIRWKTVIQMGVEQ